MKTLIWFALMAVIEAININYVENNIDIILFVFIICVFSDICSYYTKKKRHLELLIEIQKIVKKQQIK